MKYQRNELIKACAMSQQKPQRIANLSAQEAEVRCHLTWRMLDNRTYRAAFEDEAGLKGLVVDAAHFMAQRPNIVLGSSDQVPVWAKTPAGNQLYLEAEVKDKDMSQKRGAACDEQDKYRITVELRQAVYN